MAEQVLAGRHRAGIELRQRGLQRIVERIAGLLVPEQRIVAQHLGIGDRGFQIEPAVGVDRELRVLADLLQHRLDPRCDPRRSTRRRSSSSRRCSRDRDSRASRRAASTGPCRDSSSRRRHRRRRAGWRSRPWRSASRRNSGLPAIFATASHTAMSIVPTATERSPWPPGFSLIIMRRPDLVRIEIVAGLVEQRLRIGLQQPRREALADQAALAVAAVGIEAVADHRSAVAHRRR